MGKGDNQKRKFNDDGFYEIRSSWLPHCRRRKTAGIYDCMVSQFSVLFFRQHHCNLFCNSIPCFHGRAYSSCILFVCKKNILQGEPKNKKYYRSGFNWLFCASPIAVAE